MTKYVINAKPTSIVSDSRQVAHGALFLAYPGEKVDGRLFIEDAIKRGACAVLWEPKGFEWNSDWIIENMPVLHLRKQAGVIASQFYKNPSSKLWVIGVTGTNGKTSVTQWLGQCFHYLNRKSAVIGTLGNGLLNQLSKTDNTTPNPLVLHQLLSEFVENEADVVAMEVSSHGIHQGRVKGVKFDIAVLTNLSRDHLDYHGTYEKYAEVKKSLFLTKGLKHAVLNSDDVFSESITDALKATDVKVLTYGISSGDVRASKVFLDSGRINFFVTTPFGQSDVSANLIGRFNVYNVLAVLATMLLSDVPLIDAVEAVSHIEPIEGRMQKFGGENMPLVVVDYAHTPDSLKNVLLSLREQTKNRIVCVFGCGGNRDQGKRAMMGKVASELADAVVVTSDNPRNEDPEKIIQAILEGVKGEYAVEEDRARAITIAIESAEVGDIVLVAGKGHEDYQEIAGVKHPFSDAEQVQKVLKRYEVMA